MGSFKAPLFACGTLHMQLLWYTAMLVDRYQATFEEGIRSYQIFYSKTELYTLIPTVISAINILTPAFQTLDHKTKIEPDTQEDSHPEKIQGRVAFQNVIFNNPSRPEVTVLDNFILQIEAGSKVAFVGPGGAGK